MNRKFYLLGTLCVATLCSAPAFAVKPSWWGGEIQAAQGVGFGRYEIVAIPGTGAGSITGFFNLCYTDNNYQNCINYNPNENYHFETDIEFTPTGDERDKDRRWITSCLTDNACPISYPAPWPRDGSKNLLAVSLNTFTPDNQLYYKADFNPYMSYHTYVFVNLPKEVYWEIDGKKILSREPNANNNARNFPEYPKFNQKLAFKQVKLIINLWDGSQGDQGGFGGPPTTQQTPGKPAQIQRVAYYPAQCNAEGNCTIDKNPDFLMDMKNKKFLRNGKTLPSNDNICTETATPTTLWFNMTRTDYPVYVSPRHVTCDTSTDSVKITYSPSK